MKNIIKYYTDGDKWARKLEAFPYECQDSFSFYVDIDIHSLDRIFMILFLPKAAELGDPRLITEIALGGYHWLEESDSVNDLAGRMGSFTPLFLQHFSGGNYLVTSESIPLELNSLLEELLELSSIDLIIGHSSLHSLFLPHLTQGL